MNNYDFEILIAVCSHGLSLVYTDVIELTVDKLKKFIDIDSFLKFFIHTSV